ncbi:unnamed protein product [Amoebophrya sp. A120]|nr:unnamed protein product [Amoebophrya sp. A120]|eukprot:GSA120T00019789001.1
MMRRNLSKMVARESFELRLLEDLRLRFANEAKSRAGQMNFCRDITFCFDLHEDKHCRIQMATQVLLWLWRYSQNLSTSKSAMLQFVGRKEGNNGGLNPTFRVRHVYDRTDLMMDEEVRDYVQHQSTWDLFKLDPSMCWSIRNISPPALETYTEAELARRRARRQVRMKAAQLRKQQRANNKGQAAKKGVAGELDRNNTSKSSDGTEVVNANSVEHGELLERTADDKAPLEQGEQEPGNVDHLSDDDDDHADDIDFTKPIEGQQKMKQKATIAGHLQSKAALKTGSSSSAEQDCDHLLNSSSKGTSDQDLLQDAALLQDPSQAALEPVPIPPSLLNSNRCRPWLECTYICGTRMKLSFRKDLAIQNSVIAYCEANQIKVENVGPVAPLSYADLDNYKMLVDKKQCQGMRTVMEEETAGENNGAAGNNQHSGTTTSNGNGNNNNYTTSSGTLFGSSTSPDDPSAIALAQNGNGFAIAPFNTKNNGEVDPTANNTGLGGSQELLRKLDSETEFETQEEMMRKAFQNVFDEAKRDVILERLMGLKLTVASTLNSTALPSHIGYHICSNGMASWFYSQLGMCVKFNIGYLEATQLWVEGKELRALMLRNQAPGSGGTGLLSSGLLDKKTLSLRSTHAGAGAGDENINVYHTTQQLYGPRSTLYKDTHYREQVRAIGGNMVPARDAEFHSIEDLNSLDDEENLHLHSFEVENNLNFQWLDHRNSKHNATAAPKFENEDCEVQNQYHVDWCMVDHAHWRDRDARRSQSKFKEFLRSEEQQEEMKFSGYNAGDKSNGLFCSVNRDVDPTKFSCKFNKYNMWINTGFREVRAFPIYRVATNYEEYVRYINGFLHVFYVSSSVDSGLYKDLWYDKETLRDLLIHKDELAAKMNNTSTRGASSSGAGAATSATTTTEEKNNAVDHMERTQSDSSTETTASTGGSTADKKSVGKKIIREETTGVSKKKVAAKTSSRSTNKYRNYGVPLSDLVWDPDIHVFDCFCITHPMFVNLKLQKAYVIWPRSRSELLEVYDNIDVAENVLTKKDDKNEDGATGKDEDGNTTGTGAKAPGSFGDVVAEEESVASRDDGDVLPELQNKTAICDSSESEEHTTHDFSRTTPRARTPSYLKQKDKRTRLVQEDIENGRVHRFPQSWKLHELPLHSVVALRNREEVLSTITRFDLILSGENLRGFSPEELAGLTSVDE